jgi:hypothetical protein
MKPLPPINDTILVALAQLVDDAQTGRRDPSHEQIGLCVEKWELFQECSSMLCVSGKNNLNW